MPERIVTIDQLAEQELRELAQLRVERWNGVLTKEHGEQKYDASLDALRSRRAIFPEGQLVLIGEVIMGAIHALRVSTTTKDFSEPMFENWHKLTGNGLYTTHQGDGNTLVCPEVYSRELVIGETRHSGGKRLVQAALELGRRLRRESGLERMIVYTRPFIASFLKEKEEAEQAYLKAVYSGSHRDPVGMHHSLGARFVRFVASGRPSDDETAGYTAILEYPLDGRP